jgi:hypothetical protein
MIFEFPEFKRPKATPKEQSQRRSRINRYRNNMEEVLPYMKINQYLLFM